MSSKKKDIGLGLTIGMGIGVLLFCELFLLAKLVPLADVQPAAAQEAVFTTPTFSPPTLLPTASPTQTRVPTQTPASIRLKPHPSVPPPTATLMTEPLILTGPLNEREQAQLYAASLLYVAPDYYHSKRIGDAINGEGLGHPSNICGPLAIAILQDGFILSNKIIPYDFWLLNPDVKEDRLKLERTFPKTRFDSWRDKTALNQINWANSPLRAGDFLYLFSGSRGNFEHMLTVTRVDKTGRAYTVTNHAIEGEGFIITEELLYDPNKPGVGLFYLWTERAKSALGSTGFEGYQLWRLKE